VPPLSPFLVVVFPDQRTVCTFGRKPHAYTAMFTTSVSTSANKKL